MRCSSVFVSLRLKLAEMINETRNVDMKREGRDRKREREECEKNAAEVVVVMVLSCCAPPDWPAWWWWHGIGHEPG